LSNAKCEYAKIQRSLSNGFFHFLLRYVLQFNKLHDSSVRRLRLIAYLATFFYQTFTNVFDFHLNVYDIVLRLLWRRKYAGIASVCMGVSSFLGRD